MSLVRALACWGILTAAVTGLTSFISAAEKKEPSFYGPQPAVENIDLNMYARIRDEGFHHSHVMQFAGALSDGIGPRLTGSPNMARPTRGPATR